ncbi:MAG: trehalose/maltose transport system substrate-binding protein [Solirubrobacterales bacterium]|nr:trehalose/maltose transport system substrate-binding protein [Solirubrobacterales bacterium]
MHPGSMVGRVTSIVALLAAGMTLSACTASQEEGAGTRLTFFVFNEPSGAFSEAATKCSEESNGKYTIAFEYLPSDADSQREQLVRRLGAEDSSIDILGMDVIWTAEFANAGWIQPWEGDLEKQVTDGTFESVIEGATFEDTLYAAPFTSNTQLLWYRKDRVENVPKTWEEMLAESERIGENGVIQVQADQYEGFVVWVNAMLESAGATVLDGPETVSLDQQATEAALETMARFASSESAAADIDTSTEDTARLSFEAGGSSFMLNYPFVYPSAKENAPDVFDQMEATTYPAVVDGEPSAPPLGGINLGISEFSDNSDLAFEAAACLVQPDNQLTAATLGGLPPTNEDVYDSKEIEEAYPGFSDLIKTSIENAAPRPVTPAYTDLSLAIQSALHPIGDVDPEQITEAYDKLKEYVEQAVKREGLL